jgi:hypothetical protein
MEKKDYRVNLEMLNEMFPGKAAITPKEVATVLSANVDTVYAAIKKKYDPLPSNKLTKKKIVIPIPGLARWLCGR